MKAVVIIFLTFFCVSLAYSQSGVYKTPAAIDSGLAIKFKNYQSPDTWEDEYKTYRKYLGIKIRIDEGTAFHKIQLHNKQLYSYTETDSSYHKNKIKTREIHFLSNKPVRFISSIYKKAPGAGLILKHQTKVYLYQSDVIAYLNADKPELSRKRKNLLLKYIERTASELLDSLKRNPDK